MLMKILFHVEGECGCMLTCIIKHYFHLFQMVYIVTYYTYIIRFSIQYIVGYNFGCLAQDLYILAVLNYRQDRSN